MSDPFGGLPPPPEEQQARPFLPAAYGLLAALGVAYAAELWLGRDPSGESSLALLRMGALWRTAFDDGDFWRIGSYAFLHIGWLHIACNGWSIWMVMRQLELAFGSNLTLGFFSATALAAGGASLGWAALHGHDTFAAGASGGAFGLFGAEIALLFRIRHRFSAETRRSLLRQLFFNLVINLGIAVSFPVDNAAHLGGLFSGILLGLLAPQRSLPRRPWQEPVRWAVLASILVLGSLEGAAVGRVLKPKPRALRGPGVEARIDPAFAQSEPGIADSPIGARLGVFKGPSSPGAGGEQVRIGGRAFSRSRSKDRSGNDRTQLVTAAEDGGSLIVELLCGDRSCRGESGDQLMEKAAETVRAAP